MRGEEREGRRQTFRKEKKRDDIGTFLIAVKKGEEGRN